MATFDITIGKWRASDGSLHEKKENAEKHEKGITPPRGCDRVLIIIVASVSILLLYLKYIIVFGIGIRFIRKAKNNPSKKSFYKPFGWIMVLGAIVWLIYDRTIELPPIAGKAFITTKYVDLAKECEQKYEGLPISIQNCKDFHMASYTIDEVELVPGKAVKVLGVTRNNYKIETSDGKVIKAPFEMFAEGNSMEFIMPTFYENLTFSVDLLTEGQGIRIFDIFQQRPVLLKKGYYKVDGSSESIRIFYTRLDRNLTGKVQTQFHKGNNIIRADLFYNKLSEPFIHNGRNTV